MARRVSDGKQFEYLVNKIRRLPEFIAHGDAAEWLEGEMAVARALDEIPEYLGEVLADLDKASAAIEQLKDEIRGRMTLRRVK